MAINISWAMFINPVGFLKISVLFVTNACLAIPSADNTKPMAIIRTSNVLETELVSTPIVYTSIKTIEVMRGTMPMLTSMEERWTMSFMMPTEGMTMMWIIMLVMMVRYIVMIMLMNWLTSDRDMVGVVLMVISFVLLVVRLHFKHEISFFNISL